MSPIIRTLFAIICINYFILCETEIVAENPSKEVKKCCPYGQVVSKYDRCKKKNDTSLDFTDVKIYDEGAYETGANLKDYYDLETGVFGNKTFKGTVRYHGVFGKTEYYLTKDKYLYVELVNKMPRWLKLSTDEFCVDYFALNPKATPKIRFWIPKWVGQRNVPELSKARNDLITTGFIISSLFLVLVLVVYSIIPELRNIGGIILMAYVASLLGAFLTQAILRIKNDAGIYCFVLTLLAHYFWLSSFCWTNVMSLDIYWTFRGFAKSRAIHRRGVMFKFMIYCAYAWGVPLLMSIFLITISYVNIESAPWLLSPDIIENPKCFLSDAPQVVYLYCPMLVLSVVNWILFLLTVHNMRQLQNLSKVVDNDAAGNPRKQRRRFLVYLRLSVVMGINWALEVYSYYRPDDLLSYIADTYNVLLGVFIFLIFICKKSIFTKFVKKYRGYTKPRRMSKMRFSETSESDYSDGTTPVQVCAHPNGCDEKDKCKQHFNFT